MIFYYPDKLKFHIEFNMEFEVWVRFWGSRGGFRGGSWARKKVMKDKRRLMLNTRIWVSSVKMEDLKPKDSKWWTNFSFEH